jgi:agmatine deiminase
MEKDYAHMVAEISRRQAVELICPDLWWPGAEARLRAADTHLQAVTRHSWPVNDAWCRDHGPLFVIDEQGLAIVDLPFNAWGGKFSPWQEDDAIAARVAEERQLPCHRAPWTGEGGALEINTQGVLLTTESVWFNSNRNPGLQRETAEDMFASCFGVTETLWLPEGLIGDDTDGHIDTLTRFVDDDTVATVLPAKDDPNYASMSRNADKLRERFTVVPLPHPAPMPHADGHPLPATYANFLLLNDAILVPTYAQPRQDARALDLLQELYPGREVVPIPSERFIQEGGGPHCLTMQEPALTVH